MITAYFINLLNLNLQTKNHNFKTPVCNFTLQLIVKLHSLNIINEIIYQTSDGLKRYVIVSVNTSYWESIHLNTAPKLKKSKAQPLSYEDILILQKQRRVLILSTSHGLKTTSECAMLHCGGLPIVELAT